VRSGTDSSGQVGAARHGEKAACYLVIRPHNSR
jgi:hypothetical protein